MPSPIATLLRARFIVLIALALLRANLVHSAPHRYQHIVIVLEENRSFANIVGDRVNAPYLNTLIDGGVHFASMYAIQHPSQPNYMHLFSGANQGINDDNLPRYFSTNATANYPFKVPNLGSELIKAGFSFAGYSEAIEAAGTNDWADYAPHSNDVPDPHYRRRHSPWVNWIAKSSPVPNNQLAPALNLAFRDFPTNYDELPTVAFVIPNLLNDMHDGSRKDGDTWLKDHLGGYAAWARTHNSLLVVEWDEDDKASENRIPTLLYGAGLRDGAEVKGAWTHHNFLRTLEEMFGSTEHAGAAAQVRSIVGAFQDDPVVTTLSFQHGTNNYAGTTQAELSAAQPNAAFAATNALSVAYDADSAISGSQASQVLIRFASIFGIGSNQIPPNATIRSAKLLLHTPLNVTGTNYTSSGSFSLHRMLKPWDASATWQSMNAGVAVDDVEARSTASFTVAPTVDNAPAIFDVTDDVVAFQSGVANNGWVVRALVDAGTDVWTFSSSVDAATATRPQLEVTFSPPAQTPYEAWAISNRLPPANDAIGLDTDGDGIPNLLEFAFNLNPLAPDSHLLGANDLGGLPTAVVSRNLGETQLNVVFVRRKGPTAIGLIYSVQFSTDLNTWIDGAAEQTSSISADFERVSVPDPELKAEQTRFARVVVKLSN
jgi:hypothetical protein